MSHPIPPEAQTLATRLRLLAAEIESAARYGVPIPESFTVNGSHFGAAAAHTDAATFAAWADYLEADTEERRHHGHIWHTAASRISNGDLPIRVQTSRPDEEEGA